MSPRELILLSPYRLPTRNALTLGEEETASFLNGLAALWHPLALRQAVGPPRVASPYDHEQPTEGHIYAVPECPPLVLPDDWDQRVVATGAVAFRTGRDRAGALANLLTALSGTAAGAEDLGPLQNADEQQVAAFAGLGFGFAMLEALFETMEHEPVLSIADFWLDVQAAVAALGKGESWRQYLQTAAERLLAAREVIYPVTIHLLDLWVLTAKEVPFPVAWDQALPLNFVLPAGVLQQLAQANPTCVQTLRERLAAETIEICGGPFVEREDALLPIESQAWNLRRGLSVYRALLGQDIQVFARKRFASHPQLPLLLQNAGLRRALQLPQGDAVLPAYRATTVSLPSPDGKQIELYARAPHRADQVETFFHWAHYLHQTISQDHAATIALLHPGERAPASYADLIELSRLAPVFGQWTTLTRYFNEVTAGEYASVPTADEFHGDYLGERVESHSSEPVSWFGRFVRWRRRIDTAWTLAALYRSLVGKEDRLDLVQALTEIEDTLETTGQVPAGLAELEKKVETALADRLLARAEENRPGYLLLNPCSFNRRVPLELAGVSGQPARGGAVKSMQTDGTTARLVVEVPALGFVWIPQNLGSPTEAVSTRMRLADDRCVRNEFFEAEIDPATGGLKAFRDHRTPVNRLAQQLVFNPGSTMRAKQVKATSTGPALGELVSEGAILDEEGQILALFRQRFRAWQGRPALDIRIELFPQRPQQGYPWHAYYGARFAWRDERAVLLRGVNGTCYTTTQTRPETPDYLELRLGRQTVQIFPCGLPFHQRHGGRMLDLILAVEGETAQVFEIGLALDRDHPMQTAVGMTTPIAVIPCAKGPPHIGNSGWICHLDARNLVLTSLRPVEGQDAIVARLLECQGQIGTAQFRTARNPCHAVLQDDTGAAILEPQLAGDAVAFEVAASDLVQLRIDFSPGA